MKTIKANVWGAQEDVNLFSWEEIKNLGFKKSDRSFGTLNDGSQALYFSKDHKTWYVTTEKLEDIE